MRTFYVADLTPQGDLRSEEPYQYESLEQVPEAANLIVHLATLAWRSPEGFETPLPYPANDIHFRFTPTAPTAGIATVRWKEKELICVSLLLTGLNPTADAVTVQAAQDRLLAELHDTGYEPAFSLLDLKHRPMVATINFSSPPEAQLHAALVDRCFAAAYFRTHDLA